MQNPEEYKFHSEQMKEEEFLKSSFYLDMRYFKDLYLGVLMRNITKEKDYNRLYEFLLSDNYKNRLIDNVDIWFKENLFDVHHEELLATLNNEKSCIDILLLSPNTNILVTVKSFVNRALECHTIFNDSKFNLKITFNTYPLRLTNYYNIILKSFIEKILEIKCNVIYNSPKMLIKNLYNYDCLFMYDINEILKLNPFDDIDNEEKILRLSKLYFFTPKLIHDKNILKTKTKKEIDKDFEFCEQFLNIFFNFFFLDLPSISIEKDE